MNNNYFDDGLVAGGGRLSTKYIRKDLPDSIPSFTISNELDRHLVRLILLHHDRLDSELVNQDLNALDDTGKRLLLAKINSALGIQPLRDHRF